MLENDFTRKSEPFKIRIKPSDGSFEPSIAVPSNQIILGNITKEVGTLETLTKAEIDSIPDGALRAFLYEYDNDEQLDIRKSPSEKLEKAKQKPETIEPLKVIADRYEKRKKDIAFVKGIIEQRREANATPNIPPEISW